MYQRKTPDHGDVHNTQAVVRELAGVLSSPPPGFAVARNDHGSALASLSTLPAAPALVTAEEPQMPIPSTWREPHGRHAATSEAAPWKSAIVGLAVGLCVTVPTVLWLTGHGSSPLALIGVTQLAPETAKPTISAPAEVTWPVSASRGSTEPVASDGSSRPPSPDRESPAGVLTTAELLIAGGDIALARTLLEQSAAAGNPSVLFSLAETYDPNMLAAWGNRDLNADPERARGLYERAMAGGIDRARTRLQGLR
jgi:hypothetical protein